uniref:Uncharacterized protein n=1 Tax=Oryza meridionalis TaxID=40149 RepID=A0A0E0CHW9_9ORYZ
MAKSSFGINPNSREDKRCIGGMLPTRFARLPMNEGMLPVSEMAELRRYLAMEAILVEMEPPQVCEVAEQR